MYGAGVVRGTGTERMHDLNRASKVLACACALLLLAGCGAKKKEQAPPKPALTVTAAQVDLVSLPRQVDASGTIAAWQEVPVGSEAGGLEAVQVLADEGSVVRQGQLLVKLNDRLLRAQLKQQEAGVASARAVLAQQEAALKRAQELTSRGYMARASLDTALANQRTAEAQVQTAEAARAETLARLDQTNVRAPVGGLITARTVVKGQIVSVGAELFRLVRDGQIELNAEVPEADLPYVKAGMRAVVTNEQGGQSTGVVRLVTPRVDPQTRLGLARITLPASSGMRPGNFGRAAIDVGAHPAAVAPQTAVVFREGKPGVYILDAGNRVHFKPVKTGVRSGALVELVSGPQPGQRVVVQGAGFLGENDLVTVAAPAGAPARSVAR
jgi:RND family efflux transporter MFP subunit